MKPSQGLIKGLIEELEKDGAIYQNFEHILKDFENLDINKKIENQKNIDMAFIYFYLGIINLMNPNSNFNKKFTYSAR